MIKHYWAIQVDIPEYGGWVWAVEDYWDGQGNISIFNSQHLAEYHARKLEKRLHTRTRVREIKYDN